jgi:hypothetical protein
VADGNSANTSQVGLGAVTDDMLLYAGGSERIRISGGNVGIGTSSPSGNLHVYEDSTVGSYIFLENTDGSTRFQANNDSIFIDAETHIFRDSVAGGSGEYMRISGGNLLVGKASSATNTVGVELGAAGYGAFCRDSNKVAIFNRKNSDGTILDLQKDGTTVGSIGTNGGLFISNSTGNAGLKFWAGAAIVPCNADGSYSDNDQDLGYPTVRFDDIYATNGTIQTSDRNEKQDIAELSDAEQRVAVAAKGLLRKFRWRDAVEAKGDDARTHFGIIAQDLQAAFAAEGLDAGDYAMFISSTWWEHDVEVPAVEAVAEVTETTTDEDGNEVITVVTEAVEAKDAYTRTDTYDTQEEAPEGATERTRLGVRYSELLAFIIGAL